jgi:hypothetical protein
VAFAHNFSYKFVFQEMALELALDRVERWWALVLAVLNLRVLQLQFVVTWF